MRSPHNRQRRSWNPFTGVVRTDAEAEARIGQLGFVEPRIVRDAVQHGYAKTREAMTPFHPGSYAGTCMWGETTFALGLLGREWGWEHENLRGVDLISNHKTGTAVIVTAGDPATGLDAYRPQVRYERREIITALVNGELDTLWDAERGRADWNVWFLLHFVGRDEEVVPAELSLPAAIDPVGNVTKWVERIIVPPFDEGPGTRRIDPVPSEPDEPVVHVRRRAN